jgi:ATP-dependent DNA ligase
VSQLAAPNDLRLFELPVDSAVLDGEAVLLRPDKTFDFEGLRSRQGQAEAILVAYDVIEGEWQDVRQRLWENAGSAFVICSRAPQ